MERRRSRVLCYGSLTGNLLANRVRGFGTEAVRVFTDDARVRFKRGIFRQLMAG